VSTREDREDRIGMEGEGILTGRSCSFSCLRLGGLGSSSRGSGGGLGGLGLGGSLLRLLEHGLELGLQVVERIRSCRGKVGKSVQVVTENDAVGEQKGVGGLTHERQAS
jgi:hypothetical protein